MKTKLPVMLFTLLFLAPAASGIGFNLGIYGGKDFYSISEMSREFRLMDLTEASIRREGFKNPWILGVNAQLNFILGWSLNLSAEGTVRKYSVRYSRNYPVPNDPNNIKTSEYEVSWGRVAILATLKKNLLVLPTFKIYSGLGAGIHLIAPVVSDKFLVNTLADKSVELDPSADVELESRFGGQLLVGAQFSPPLSPLKFKLDAKYLLTSTGDYEEPTHFLNLTLGIMFGF